MTNSSIWVLAPLTVLATLIMAANLYLVGGIQLLSTQAGSYYYSMTGNSDGASFPFIGCYKWRGSTTNILPSTSQNNNYFKTLMTSHFLLPSVRTEHSHKESMMNRPDSRPSSPFLSGFLDPWVNLISSRCIRWWLIMFLEPQFWRPLWRSYVRPNPTACLMIDSVLWQSF